MKRVHLVVLLCMSETPNKFVGYTLAQAGRRGLLCHRRTTVRMSQSRAVYLQLYTVVGGTTRAVRRNTLSRGLSCASGPTVWIPMASRDFDQHPRIQIHTVGQEIQISFLAIIQYQLNKLSRRAASFGVLISCDLRSDCPIF